MHNAQLPQLDGLQDLLFRRRWLGPKRYHREQDKGGRQAQDRHVVSKYGEKRSALKAVDLHGENAYYGAPFPRLAAWKFWRSRPPLQVGSERSLLFYGAHAGCDVEADAGVPRGKHRQGADIGSSPSRSVS